MTLRSALLAATFMALPIVASAQPVSGLYVGAGAGINMLTDESASATGAPSGKLKADKVGPAFVLSLGYGFGNGLRAEIEGDYRSNRFNNASGFGGATGGGGQEQKYGVMANALFDFSVAPWLMPYVGAGVGYQASDWQNVRITGGAGTGAAQSNVKGSFAYQGIAGVGFPIASAPGLALTAEYRFLGLAGDRNYSGVGGGSVKSTDDYNHSFLVGVRYAFGAAPVVAAAAATQAPAAAMARSYLVFFDWDKASLTDRARGIIKDAAVNSTKVAYTKIDVNGNADTSGTHAYNQGLSMRRAEAVAAELVKDGVPKNAIVVTASGDTKPLVPTGPGVREPQNRRVEINIR